tara:strand:+ start:25009 stop:25830 length:822 start_codon:yes stop_codon:yes gene_type:complete
MDDVRTPVSVSRSILRLTASNGDDYTLAGTNTWIVLSPDGSEAVIVDPGPAEPDHERAIHRAVRGRRVRAIVLTHFHDDHSDLAPALHDALAAPVLARDQRLALGAGPIEEGYTPRYGAVPISVVSTPGHTHDSISVLVRTDAALLTGDTFLGGAPTMIDYPDGDLGDYLRSLESMLELARTLPLRYLLPGHGDASADPVGALSAYIRHRRVRLEQVAVHHRAGRNDADDIVQRIYPTVNDMLRPAALQNVQASLAYLNDRATTTSHVRKENL